MTDAELNKALAEVMGYAPKPDYKNGTGACNARMIDYKDPAIFAQCVKFLLHHGISIDAIWALLPKHFEKAVALACVKVGKEEG